MFGSRLTATRRSLVASAAAALAAPALTRPTRAGGPMLGVSMPVHHRFKLGGFEVTTLLDAAVMIDGPWPIVGEDRPAEEVERLMHDSLLPRKRFRPGFSPTIVNTGREIVLFDAGNGENGFVPRPAGGRLSASMRTAGIAPDQIDVVALTHCHPDHIGGLMEAGHVAFPNARYALGEAEHAFWSDPRRLSAPEGSNELNSARMFSTNVARERDRVFIAAPGQEIAPGIVALEAFGHTPGHLAFHVESEGRRLLIWGDCAHHDVASLARPEWSAFFDMDKEQGVATRRRIYDMAATDRLAVVGYHTSFPSVGFVERRTGGGYRWLPASYQFES
jgi:glyoxylase-like metal-dependent hydrolase (beta-lactamase superfamily II)